MMIIIAVLGWLFILSYFLNDFSKGLVIHKATLSHFKYGFIPRFTAREPNGRFKANKVGIFFIATH